MNQKKKIAILGGGVAGCSAAYWLTHTAELREQYEVTLYQMGWRLGGKGASGRNAKEGFRSEEHGPHVWYGGYENALRMLRDCYTEYFRQEGRHGPYTTIIGDDQNAAFLTSKEAGFIKEDGDQQHVWHWEFPSYDGTDGDGSPAPDGWDMVLRIVDLIKLNVRSDAFLDKFFKDQWRRKRGGNKRIAINEETDPFDTLSQEIEDTRSDLKSAAPRSFKTWAALRTIEILQAITAAAFSSFPEQQDALKIIELSDCFLACGHGLVEERFKKKRTFEEMDQDDFQTFLRAHGATRWSIEESAFARSYYDAAFAYPGGGKGDFGAGTALRGFLWIFFGYKGSYIYKMQGGMGEIVFTPIYEVLKHRVDFQFFHRIDRLELSEDHSSIEKLHLTEQAKLACGIERYDPLIDIPGGEYNMKCGPTEPNYDQLAPSSEPPPGDPGYESPWSQLTGDPKELRQGEDFDEVLLAIPVSALKSICGELIEHSPRFATMVEGLKTVRSIAAQLWLTGEPDEPSLWHERGFSEPVLSGGAAGEWDIWMDYSATLPSEGHGSAIRHLLYGCGVMPDDPNEPNTFDDPCYPSTVREAKRNDLRDWLASKSPQIWTEFKNSEGEFDSTRLFTTHGDSLECRMQWQYCRTNIEGTERYTTPASQTVDLRLTPGQSGFANLTLAGDWTKNGIDIGCVEAASTSGMLAIEHLTGLDLDVRLPNV